MAGRTARERAEREARKRLRGFTARQSVHARQITRRRRDNIAAGIAIVVVAALATFAQIGYFTVGPGAPTPKVSASPSPSSTAAVPDKALADDRTWTGTMTINGAKLGISLDGKKAPQAVANFITLAQKGFYNGAYCPRLTTKTVYILQCGSPTDSTDGGPGYSFGPIENAPADGVYKTGVIAMARTSSATGQGSQFFIIYGADSTFPADSYGGYTVFGSVTSGLPALKTDVVDKGLAASAVATGDGAPKSTVKISSVTVK